MKSILLIIFCLTAVSYSEVLTEKEFSRIISLKGDEKKLPEQFNIYKPSSKSTIKLRYEYSKDNIQVINLECRNKTIEGKYFVTEAYDKELNSTFYSIMLYDEKDKCFYTFVMMPDVPIYKAKGTIKDNKTVIWESKNHHGIKCIGVEKVNGKKSFVKEKYYDPKGKFIFNGYVSTEYE